MEKIKQLLQGGKSDETTQESGHTSGTSEHTAGKTHAGLAGEGFGTGTDSSHATPTPGHSTGLAGEGSHLANKTHDTTGTGLTGQHTTGTGVGNTQHSGIGGVGNTGNTGNTRSTGLSSDEDSIPRGSGGGILNSQTTPGHNTSTQHGIGGHDSNLAGQGSHLAGSRDVTGTGNTSGLTDQHTTGTGLGSSEHTGIGGVGNTRDTGFGSEQSRLTGNNSNDPNFGNTGHSGPHKTEAANLLDPNLNLSPTKKQENAHEHHKLHGGGAEEADKHHGSPAVTSTGGGFAGHEHSKHQDESTTGVGSTGLGHSTTGQHDTTNTSGSHLGRDAAIGAGGVGAAGLAERKHNQHQQGAVGGLDGSGTSSVTTGHTANPTHQGGSASDHLGRNTTAAGSVGAGGYEAGRHGHNESAMPGSFPLDDNTTAGQRSNLADRSVGSDQSKDHHYGRDAAVAGGVGGAAYEADKHHNEHPTSNTTTGTISSGYTGQHSSNLTDRPVGNDQSKDHHYGRDAAVAGGVGGAAYEADKHHNERNRAHPALGDQGHTALQDRIFQSKDQKDSKGGNLADRTVDSDNSKDHHYGRDTAVAGGVGGAAYEADKHHNKHDQDRTASHGDQKHQHKEHQHKEHEHDKHDKESKGGILSFLHRDKSKNSSKEEEAEFDRQQREHDSHKGRDAALAGAAVGAGGYAADKHHHDTAGTNKPLPTASGNQGIGTGAGTQNALAGDHSASSGSHLGRDAAVVGGAGAIGQHEHDSHNTTPLEEKARGEDLGDKLHGSDRNRGVTGASGFPGTEGYGSGPTHSGTHQKIGDTVGLAGPSTTNQFGVPWNSKESHGKVTETSGTEGIGSGPSTTHSDTHTGSGTQHHLGRDAALGAGGVGGVGAAEHERRKHDNLTSNSSGAGLTGTGTNSNQSDSSQDRGLGYPYDDSSTQSQGLGKSGLGGDNEYSQHNTTTGQQSGITGNQGSSGLTGSDGRNRLHKDPPSSHFASQGGVPSSGSETINQGEQRLGGNSDVTGAHSNSGTTNY